MAEPSPTPEDLRAAHCWFDVDVVPGDAAATAWKRQARLRQATWRAARKHPIGAEPYGGGPGSRPVGSRLELAFARETPANFLTEGARAAVRWRLAHREHGETLREDRLWADLLSSMPLCFNLFGELHGNGPLARTAVDRWWPGAPAGPVTVRFEHSPGRLDPDLLGNRSAFDVAFEIEVAPDRHALFGVETKYHEHARAERAPAGDRLCRYLEVAERSEVFADGWQRAVIGTDLQQLWLDHLLALSMRQHPRQRWADVRFVLAYPAANPSFASAAARYHALLRDASTFEVRTLEDLLAPGGPLPPETVRLLRERYLG